MPQAVTKQPPRAKKTTRSGALKEDLSVLFEESLSAIDQA